MSESLNSNPPTFVWEMVVITFPLAQQSLAELSQAAAELWDLLTYSQTVEEEAELLPQLFGKSRKHKKTRSTFTLSWHFSLMLRLRVLNNGWNT